MRQILTDALCRTKPPRTGRLEIADLRQAGLVLRITSNGARSFAYRFRHPHTRKTLRATIGPYPAMTLEAARKRAKDMAAQVAEGTNPIEARNTEREAAPTRTFEALAARYLKEHAERHKRPRSAEEDRRNLAVSSCRNGASAISGLSDAPTSSSSLSPSSALASTLRAIASTASSARFSVLQSTPTFSKPIPGLASENAASKKSGGAFWMMPK